MNEEQIAKVLAEHGLNVASDSGDAWSPPEESASCHCGHDYEGWVATGAEWSYPDWMEDHSAHLAAVLEPLILAAQAEEVAEYEAINIRMEDILNRTAAALKGEPGPMTMHSWHDLPEWAAKAKAEAFEQGQKSGMRHADRLAAAERIGRPDLPGPISPNPYRTT